MTTYGGVEVYIQAFLITALGGGELSIDFTHLLLYRGEGALGIK
jgi:hypothetical protein